MKAGSNSCKSATWLLVPLMAAGMAFGKLDGKVNVTYWASSYRGDPR